MAAVLIISRFLYEVFRSHFRIRAEQGHLTLTRTGNAGNSERKARRKDVREFRGKTCKLYSKYLKFHKNHHKENTVDRHRFVLFVFLS